MSAVDRTGAHWCGHYRSFAGPLSIVFITTILIVFGGGPLRAASTVDQLYGTYDGAATVNLTTYDFCPAGEARRATGTETYEMSAQMIIGEGKSDGTSTEQSPFNLMLTIGDQTGQGSISLASALGVDTSGQDIAGNPRSPQLLLNYWKLAWSDGKLNGQLVDDHRAEAAAYNLFQGQKPIIPCRPDSGYIPDLSSISPGATLEGTLNPGNADLLLRGATYNGLYEFQARFQSS